MLSRKSVLLGLAFAAATFLGTAVSRAQSVQDSPSYKGFGSRQGRNGDPVNSGPGRRNLRWFTPGGANYSTRQPIIDNTDTIPTRIDPNDPDGYPDDANPYGSILESPSNAGADPHWTGAITGVTRWVAPLELEEAYSPYLKPIRSQPLLLSNGVTAPANYNSRFPAYVFTTVTPSSTGSQTQAATPANLRSFTWNFKGVTASPENYGVYVNLPVGFTLVNGQRIYSQRYFVYEVRFGPGGNSRYVDVVDTWISGGGWVRLGNGGMPTNRVFGYDGAFPIRVTLYNTVPRDASGNLLEASADIPNRVVYADAVRFDPAPGFYQASPVSARLDDANTLSTVVTAANNELTVGLVNGASTTVAKGVVTNYQYSTGSQRWRYSPLEENGYPVLVDNEAVNTAGVFEPDVNLPRYAGPDAVTAPIDNTAASGTVTYAPSLANQTYDIYVYLPGDRTADGFLFGRNVQYQVTAGGETFYYNVDQSLPRGWVRLGDRRFLNDSTLGPIRVVVTNYSSDPADSTRGAYADAIRFVGESNSSITSTPVHATVGIKQNDGTIVDTKVVIVADENGVLHCLDANGKADGTTTEYWTYPSMRDSTGYDPNLGKPGAPGPDYNGPDTTAAKDRVPSAEMPQGFGLTSATVQRIGGKDYVYIGSVNGRVYCIDAAGRGDFNGTDPASGGTRISGTTTRSWTYPATYPSKITFTSSDLGSIRGSVVFGDRNGTPTIYVPTAQGRIYALNAIGNADESTNVAWTFPKQTVKNLGPILATPSLDFGRLYFGTMQNTGDVTGDVAGRFFSIDAVTGNETWRFPTDAQLADPNFRTTDDFLTSPATATGAQIEPLSATPFTGRVFVMNQNHVLYSLDADTGEAKWSTDELGVGVEGSLTFTWQTVYDNGGLPTPAPVVVLPTQDGRLVSMYADDGIVNRAGTKRAAQYTTQGDNLVASAAVSNGWMYAADDAGYLYAFNNDLGLLTGGDVPGSDDIVENDVRGDLFRKAKIALVKGSVYRQLRLISSASQGAPNNAPTYAQAVNASNFFNRSPRAFEWGETAYIFVYDFPFLTTDANGNPVDPPLVNLQISVDGKTVNTRPISARQFSQPTTAPTYNSLGGEQLTADQGGDHPMDGYGIYAFPFQNSGQNSIPPGNVTISLSFQTAGLTGQASNIAVATTTSSYSFVVANPLAIIVPATDQQAPTDNPDNLGTTSSVYRLGVNPTPGQDFETLLNGRFSPAVSPKALLAATVGAAADGQSKTTRVYLVDRSMMALLRPDRLKDGLSNVRLNTRSLGWEGGSNAVIKPLNPTSASYYQNFEDLPVNLPNNSLDYPDITRSRITAVKDPNGNAENPLFADLGGGASGVTLRPPTKADGTAIDEDTDPSTRILRATPLDITVNVPKYQPANKLTLSEGDPSLPFIKDSSGSAYMQGYLGGLEVYVDSVTNNRLDITQKEPYRAFNLAVGVLPNERLSITSPTVDLGSLSGGAGYTPGGMPGSDGVFSPWGGPFASIFKTFGVQNEGNVNLLDLRLAKAGNFSNPFDANQTDFLKFFSPANDSFTYLDSSFDLWSDIDSAFSAGPDPSKRVFLLKPRVQDAVPTQLVSNPVRRANPNLGVTGTTVVNGVTIPDALNQSMNGSAMSYPPGDPKVGVSVPIGFPVGKYTEKVRVFENDNSDYVSSTTHALWDIWGRTPEPYTDQGFALSFNVRETRLTTSAPNLAAPMLDNNLTPGGSNGQYSNANVQPAAARDAFGSLVVAFASNRPDWDTMIGTADNGAYRLFFGTLDNAATFSSNLGSGLSNAAGTSPLRDLNAWNGDSANNRWFKHAVNAPYPSATPATLFSLGSGESALPGSVRYGNPAFPTLGSKDPFNPSNSFTGMYMAFTGQIQRQNADNTVQPDSRLMLAVVTPDASGGLSVSPTPAVLNDNVQAIKGKPAVLQTGGSGTSTAIVLYPATAGGQSSILYTRFDGTQFAPSVSLPFGSGFTSVGSPSVVGRFAPDPTTGAATTAAELTFQGRLKGRPYPEVFLGRLRLSGANGASSTSPDRLYEDNTGKFDPNNVFMWLPPESNELLQADSEAGVYRARGVYWKVTDPVTLVQVVNGVQTNLLIDGTGATDQQTGVVSYDTRLGGKVYFDPQAGIVRFSSAAPARTAQLRLTYTPRFFRVSSGGAGYYDPSAIFENHLITDPTYWMTSTGAYADFTTTTSGGDPLTDDRMIFTFSRAAVGSSTAQPMMTTMRFGLRLPYRIATNENGAPVSVSVSVAGGNEAYQVDPSQGRIYFPRSAEGRKVTVTYTAVDDSGKLSGTVTTDGTISLIFEQPESLVPIEVAVNESGLAATLDPFQYTNMNPRSFGGVYRRPPLVWMFWSSTRNGSPDLFFESVSPKWNPVPLNK